MSDLAPEDLARIAWALRYTASEAERQACPAFAQRLTELAAKLDSKPEVAP